MDFREQAEEFLAPVFGLAAVEAAFLVEGFVGLGSGGGAGDCWHVLDG